MKFVDPQIEVLKVARKVLASQERFIQHAWAVGPVKPGFKKSDGSLGRVDFSGSTFERSNNPKACAWCAEGAIMKAAGDLGHDAEFAKACIEAADKNNGTGRDIQTINDRRGHKATVKALDTAIAKLTAKFKKEQTAEAC
jgi:hypothetical protein